MSTRPPAPARGTDLGILLNLAFGAFKDALHDALASHGFDDLGGSFGYVLRTLEPHRDGMRLTDLAAALGVTPQGTLKIVEDMVAKRYVTRSPDPDDSRVKRLRVAPRGEALLAQARAFHRRYEAQLARRHGADDVAALRRVLESLATQDGSAPSVRMQLL